MCSHPTLYLFKRCKMRRQIHCGSYNCAWAIFYLSQLYSVLVHRVFLCLDLLSNLLFYMLDDVSGQEFLLQLRYLLALLVHKLEQMLLNHGD